MFRVLKNLSVLLVVTFLLGAAVFAFCTKKTEVVSEEIVVVDYVPEKLVEVEDFSDSVLEDTVWNEIVIPKAGDR